MKNKETKKEKWKYSWAVQDLFITFAFLTLVIVSLILALLVAYILKKKDML